MPLETSAQPPAALARLGELEAALGSAIRGKADVLRMSLVCLLARGHLLLEDVPGVGKTVLARALARSLHTEFRRVQCTPDLLPSDVTGTAVFDPRRATFELRKGPVFTHVLLADEINRATPRTQSAFLEAMEEGQVSIDGATHLLPDPFFLIATQNPIELTGTFPLPEAQLDRFLVRLSLGYPDESVELAVLSAQREVHPLRSLQPVADAAALREAQEAVTRIPVHDSVMRYLQRLAAETRRHPHAAYGASPRGALGLMRTAQALAALAGDPFVTPDHVKRAALPVLAHRVVVNPRSRVQGVDGATVVEEVLRRVPVPVELDRERA